MIFDILLILFNLLGFEDKPKYDLRKKEDTFKLNRDMIILISGLLLFILVIGISFLIGSCTESGLYYYSHIH